MEDDVAAGAADIARVVPAIVDLDAVVLDPHPVPGGPGRPMSTDKI